MLDAIAMARHACLLATAIACVYTDMARDKIYNGVTLGGAAAGLAFAWIMDAAVPGLPNVQAALLSALAGGGILLLIYFSGGMGAGDVKLMVAVGMLAASWRFTLMALMYGALVGAVISLGVLIWQGRLREGLKGSARALLTLRTRKDPSAPRPPTIPYGVAIGIGVVWAWMETVVL